MRHYSLPLLSANEISNPIIIAYSKIKDKNEIIKSFIYRAFSST